MIKLNKTRFRSKLDRFFNSPGRVRALFITLIILVLILGASNFFNTISKGTDENLFQDTKNGITLIAITKGGASDRAGLKVGDVILRINDRSVANALEAHRVIYESDVGNTLEYVVQRNGEQLTFQVVLASFGVNKLVVILYLTGLMGLIAAALFGLLRPHLKEARLLSATFLFFGASLFSALTLDISVSSALQGLSSPMTLFLFFYSGLYFPVLRRDILEHRWLIRAFKLSGFIVVTCCLIGILLILQNLDSNQFLSFAKPISYTLRVLILLLALFGLIIFVVHRKTRPPETKRY
ncbi:MAG: PDZ domain-containing protein, partial [bacterium]